VEKSVSGSAAAASVGGESSGSAVNRSSASPGSALISTSGSAATRAAAVFGPFPAPDGAVGEASAPKKSIGS
jgi:hypothetical protein